jgi:hypothetical protein
MSAAAKASLYWRAVGLAGQAECPRLAACYLKAVKG